MIVCVFFETDLWYSSDFIFLALYLFVSSSRGVNDANASARPERSRAENQYSLALRSSARMIPPRLTHKPMWVRCACEPFCPTFQRIPFRIPRFTRSPREHVFARRSGLHFSGRRADRNLAWTSYPIFAHSLTLLLGRVSSRFVTKIFLPHRK